VPAKLSSIITIAGLLIFDEWVRSTELNISDTMNSKYANLVNGHHLLSGFARSMINFANLDVSQTYI
jgi:hypothetical protein